MIRDRGIAFLDRRAVTPLSRSIRLVRRDPSFYALAAGTLGLALALATTMFTLLDAVRHPVVPYPQPERAFTVWLRGRPSVPPAILEQDFEALRSARTVSVAAAGILFNTIADAGGAARTVVAARATLNLFQVLGVRPQLGRDFANGARGEGDAGVIVSDGIWRALLHQPRTLRNATIALNGTSYPVIGVAPSGVRFPYDIDVWIPAPMSAPGTPDLPYPWIVARLRGGATLPQARGELAALSRRLSASVGQKDPPFSYELSDLRSNSLQLDDHHALAAAAVIVLLIACANAANLVSVRGVARRRELALRAALGASRRALVKHQLAECVAIAVAAGAFGLVGGEWGAALIAAAIPPYLTGGAVLVPPHIAWRVYVFVLVATWAVLVGFGVLPALRASRVDPSEPLKRASPTTTSGRGAMGGLVAGQIALALVVLFGAGLMWRTAARIGDYDFGYDARDLLVMRVGIAPHDLPNGTTADDAFRALADRASRVAGVRAAAQMSFDDPDHSQILGESGAEATRTLAARYFVEASPNLLRTLGIPVIAGRDFLDGDASSAGVAIVDERAAAALWPTERAIGHEIELGSAGSGAPWIPVVGVARNASLFFEHDPDLEPQPIVYVVRAHEPGAYREVVLRAGPSRGSVATAVTRAVETTPALHDFQSPVPWLEQYDHFTAGRRFGAFVLGLYGVTALVLATIGLYTVLAYSVSRRRHEFGVRLALGARPADLRRMVVGEALVMALAGIASGAMVALWVSQLLDSALYGIPHMDAVSLAGAEILLLGIALVACLAPAERASRAEPLEVLRQL
ncbi:MAG TPA: FtsX-like permease family protein [Gemmatimonadaceae bacterium]